MFLSLIFSLEQIYKKRRNFRAYFMISEQIICIFDAENHFVMSENLIIAEGGKQERYALLYKQVKALVKCENDTIANMANIAAMIHTTFNFWWTGFYRVAGNELVLGPFQGPLACSRIAFGKGVCGTAWKEQRTVEVADVDLFPGHIACSSLSRSEIVVPVWHDNKIIAVLDIDSQYLATFDEIDKHWLEMIVETLYHHE